MFFYFFTCGNGLQDIFGATVFLSIFLSEKCLEILTDLSKKSNVPSPFGGNT